MVTSKFNWLTVLILISLLTFGCVIFISGLEISVSDSSVNGKWALLSLFLGTVEVYAIISVILNSQKIIITDVKITIKYLLLLKEHSYNIRELQGYHRNRHRPVGGRLPYHKSLDILAPDGRLFNLNSLIFSNYTQLTNMVAANSKSIKIDKWNYRVAKLKLIGYSIVATMFVSAAILLIKGY
jgi:hypothetical protein